VELALRNAAPTDEDAEALRHIEHCTHCRDELRSLTRLVTAARSAQLVDLPTAPPERVWQGVSRNLSDKTPPHRPRTSAHTPRGTRKLLATLSCTALAAGVIVCWFRHVRSKAVP
jgi:anti-sigma factor RsiW